MSHSGARPEDKALERGIQRRLVDVENLVHGPAWYRAWEAKEVVGTCRVYGCDGLIVARPNHTVGRVLWHGAECLSCGREIAIRSDKPLFERSMSRSEMRPGAWEKRERHLKAVHDMKKRAA